MRIVNQAVQEVLKAVAHPVDLRRLERGASTPLTSCLVVKEAQGPAVTVVVSL